MHGTLLLSFFFFFFLNVLTYIFTSRSKPITVFVHPVKGLGRKLPPIQSARPLQFFTSMWTELLSLKGGWTAFLGNAHRSPTFCRAFQRCLRTRSSYTPWKHPYPHELLPFLMHFLSFFMWCYHIRKLNAEQQPPRNCSSLTTLEAAWACWTWTGCQERQRQDKQGTTMASKVGSCLGFFMVVQLCLSICPWQFYRGFEGKGRKFTWCLVDLKNPSPKLQRDFLKNSISGQVGHYKIQLVAAKPEQVETDQRAHEAETINLCLVRVRRGSQSWDKKAMVWSKQWVRKIIFLTSLWMNSFSFLFTLPLHLEAF